MNSTTKIILAAGALALAGAGGVATFASADSRGGWHGKDHGHHGKHWRGHRFKRQLRLMERFDADGNGELTQDELNKARTQLLEKHDGDKDGELSLAEFEKLWIEVMRRRMVRSFQRIDEDGNAQVTLDEFLKPYAHMVERFDRNGDGKIDKEDRKRHRHHRSGDDRGGKRDN